MRHIACTLNVDGVPTKINIRKVAKERRFLAIVDQTVTEYIISDETNEVEYYEGPKLDDYLFEKIAALIKQYFPKVKAIVKVGEDNYEDYDDY
ncbi:hypothetical protein HGH92_12755 [Chitinophaga varians]|jgi:hypothetical protein|uniref:Uncharacterized protein n=5 Tax=Chitinophaga TaxID=79328 RepID=A0AAE7D8W7_9BACT|nr:MULTISPECIES: hypothetical protein [Chitinophaga]MBC9933692.1 hypothetical protein [Chitinophaga qingshengii]NLR65180.1 hypothetical protein [Chitinophaga varians]NML35947.1 hypothetical protein [Chitinophaga fulva]QJB34216.1 hypothetical protein HF329_24160 [Chitinophaga oryzae]QJB40737.1 hypothetical protein HF324_24015 [Chitinophaga oryzae]